MIKQLEELVTENQGSKEEQSLLEEQLAEKEALCDQLTEQQAVIEAEKDKELEEVTETAASEIADLEEKLDQE